MKIYTRKGDDGTTGLLFGGRVAKNSPQPTAYGAVDEAQATLGFARSLSERGSEIDQMLVALERDLWVLMAELATDPASRDKLVPGQNLVTAEMVEGLERQIDAVSERFELPTEFVVPGETPVAGALDVARTVVRRAERDSLEVAADGSHAVSYLNRLSDLVWALARWQEGTSVTARRAES